MVIPRDVDVAVIMTGAEMKKQDHAGRKKKKEKVLGGSSGSFGGDSEDPECLCFFTVWAWGQCFP